MKIRKVTKEDLVEISDIFRIESAKKPYFQKWNKKTALRDITKSFKEDDFYIYVIDKKIVGFIISQINENNEGYVNELWIIKEFQGKGIGKALTKFIEDKYKKKEVKSIGLTANQRAGAVNFYKKLKYKVKHELFYMVKKLK